MLQTNDGTHHVINHAHLFAGLGGGARGFNSASSRVKSLTASAAGAAAQCGAALDNVGVKSSEAVKMARNIKSFWELEVSQERMRMVIRALPERIGLRS